MPDDPTWARSEIAEMHDEGLGSEDMAVLLGLPVERVKEIRREVLAQPMIATKQDVMGGQPCIAGTRITVWAIWEFNQAGYSIDSIREEYPSLTEAQVRAAIDWVQRIGTRGLAEIMKEREK